MWTVLWWRDAAERAVATAAEAGAGLLLVDALPVGVLAVDWRAGLSLVASAALLSVLKSLAASRIGDPDSASLVPSVGRHRRADGA